MSGDSSPYRNLVLKEVGDGVLLLTLNRPQAANALDRQMATELASVFARLRAEPEAWRCVVLTGAGERAFCAGADLKERETLAGPDAEAQYLAIAGAIRAVLESPVPVIAAVNGAAYAGGLEIVLSCDFAYAADTARLALTEVAIGIMPGGGGTQLLSRIAGEPRAKEIILTGRPFSATEAQAWGIVNRVCPGGQVVAEAIETARRIASNPRLSVSQARHAIHAGLQMDLGSGLQLERDAYQRLLTSAGRKEGLAAFKEKRPPRFEG
ncbi:enoyl-CoA hydratase/isomerase family protein [Roseomonas sp. SSH11]|uniref:Enoyl-CoA hydratase/isomerase family protein n=1 Tax=Pararoseomonas baculiformis TaxID=2820812 RepID=A0ABS4AH94_9PROT|nr:enoyl-CoA hydratase-related protein [Pararoseomonas baculiformis]MBP0445900.1 enoyl-CoA hydratase/isomerase family protein [Pararoseomonas baculiformis]